MSQLPPQVAGQLMRMVIASSSLPWTVPRASGPSTVAGYLDATGLDMVVYGFGYLTATNSGAMDVSSQYALAQGMYLQAQGGGYVDATNTGDVDVYAAHGLATGIHAGATFGYVTVDNSGSISATECSRSPSNSSTRIRAGCANVLKNSAFNW